MGPHPAQARESTGGAGSQPRRPDAVERVVERRVDAVAGRLDDQSVQALHGVARQRVVPGERSPHAVGLSLP
jgi:hypothetical protein